MTCSTSSDMTGIGCNGARGISRLGLPVTWQIWQVLQYLPTSHLRPGQKQWRLIQSVVLLMPKWPATQWSWTRHRTSAQYGTTTWCKTRHLSFAEAISGLHLHIRTPSRITYSWGINPMSFSGTASMNREERERSFFCSTTSCSQLRGKLRTQGTLDNGAVFKILSSPEKRLRGWTIK